VGLKLAGLTGFRSFADEHAGVKVAPLAVIRGTADPANSPLQRPRRARPQFPPLVEEQPDRSGRGRLLLRSRVQRPRLNADPFGLALALLIWVNEAGSRRHHARFACWMWAQIFPSRKAHLDTMSPSAAFS